MGLLARAVRAAHESFVFDNSDSTEIEGPRLIVRIRATQLGQMIDTRSTPVPEWVRHFVLDPLGHNPSR
jgi:hypothetical protein